MCPQTRVSTIAAMQRFQSRDMDVSAPPVFEVAPLDINAPTFAGLAAAHGLVLEGDAGSPGAAPRVRNIYLNDPALQRIYPLGLLPLGQRDFLGWLTSHGRADQQLTDAQIMDFLRESASRPFEGWRLTYLLQPGWQRAFPSAMTEQGWPTFHSWIQQHYGDHMAISLPERLPAWANVDDSRRERGVNLLSHFCNPSGIQQAALWTKAALQASGYRTSGRDVPVPRRIVPQNRENWLGQETYLVTILNQAALPYFQSGYDRAGLWPGENIYRIAYWNWELESVPDEWIEAAELVDEIWSPTEFVAKAMRACMPRPVYHMLPGVEVGPVEPVSRVSLGVPEDHFVYLFMFDLHSQVHRKNPVGVFRAFEKAFRETENATLVIKTSGGDIHSADLEQLRGVVSGRNVVLLDQLMTRAQAYGLIATCDCFVSLHRSEGFGLGLAEAMLLGKPVIATGYSGNLDFMNSENSLLVDYEMVEITEDRPIYTRGNVWAEPSVDHAAALMRQVFERPEEARRRALGARQEVARHLSLESAGNRMRARLEQICRARHG